MLPSWTTLTVLLSLEFRSFCTERKLFVFSSTNERQWAAVRIHDREIRVPPQDTFRPFRCFGVGGERTTKRTCHGKAYLGDISPLTILQNQLLIVRLSIRCVRSQIRDPHWLEDVSHDLPASARRTLRRHSSRGNDDHEDKDPNFVFHPRCLFMKTPLSKQTTTLIRANKDYRL